MRKLTFSALAFSLAFAGCVSVQDDAIQAREAIRSGNTAAALKWCDDLANESSYSQNLGAVEAGRVRFLTDDMPGAETWFRKAVDSVVDRKEREPKIKIGDVGNALLASTVTDDRTRQYYLPPYEINFAFQYAILAQCFNGKREDALVDARLAVYVQDNLAATYGVDVQKKVSGDDAKANSAADRLSEGQSSQLAEMMASTRNSWENPVLWWLTGVLFEADGDMEMAWQSYRKAAAVRPDCSLFAREALRADKNEKSPAPGKARLVVLYEQDFVPLRESLKVPVPIYTGFGIDIPMYKTKTAHAPKSVSISGVKNLLPASPAVDVRALAARDLSEQLPGVILRNITRAAVQAGAQAAANASGNDYAKIGVFIANLVVTAVRRADTRSWVTLPDGQQVWSEDAVTPGDYQIGFSVDGRTHAVPVTLKAGETVLVWIADLGTRFQSHCATLSTHQ